MSALTPSRPPALLRPLDPPLRIDVGETGISLVAVAARPPWAELHVLNGRLLHGDVVNVASASQRRRFTDALLTQAPAARPHRAGVEQALLDLRLALDTAAANGDAAASYDESSPAHGGLVAVTTATDLLARAFPPADPVVPGFLYEGLVLFIGREKAGKSAALLRIAHAVASGGYVFGTLPVRRGAALFVDLENSARRTQRRLREYLQDEPPPAGLHIATAWPRLDAGGQAALAAWLDEHPDTRLIVVDTLKRLRPLPQPGARWYDADYDALAPLQALAAEHPGLSIVVVHHANKLRNPEDALDAVSGSTGLGASADGVLIWSRQRGSDEATIVGVHRDAEADATLLVKWDPQLRGPRLVSDQLDTYHRGCDPLARFLDAEAERDPAAWTPKRTLLDAYRRWCRAHNLPVETDTAVGKKLAARGISSKQRRVGEHPTWCYIGVRLAPPAADNEQRDSTNCVIRVDRVDRVTAAAAIAEPTPLLGISGDCCVQFEHSIAAEPGGSARECHAVNADHAVNAVLSDAAGDEPGAGADAGAELPTGVEVIELPGGGRRYFL